MLRLATDPAALAAAGAMLRAGKLVAFPTETVYGLGANALDAAAVAGIYRAKGRPARNPLIVHAADTNAARASVAEWPAVADRLAARFWPGPLTLVLPRSTAIPDIVTGGGPTVGVRVPAHPVALGLLQAAGVPVAAPSANPANAVSPTTADHVARGLAGRIDALIDGGPTPGGLESAVLDLSTDPPRLLRPGTLDAATLAAFLGVPLAVLTRPTSAHAAALPAPGMFARHYAPATPLEAIPDSAAHVQTLLEAGRRVGWVCTATPAPHPLLVAVSLPPTPLEFAAGLYAALHTLDAADVERIVVDLPPDEPAWAAVRDRLRRAAHPASRSSQ